MTTNKPVPESLDQIADATAAGLAQAAADSAFSLFRDRQFRRLAGIEQLSQTEQDRIFNELLVASVVLIMLLLEAPALRLGRELRTYLVGLNKRVPKAHVDHEEFARARHDVRAAAMRIESSGKALALDDLSKIQLLVPVQSVAIGCHHHVCHGETEGKDELFKLMLKSLSMFYVELRVRFEGGRITPLTRALMALKRTLRRMGTRRR
jgi:hypothetical protein